MRKHAFILFAFTVTVGCASDRPGANESQPSRPAVAAPAAPSDERQASEVYNPTTDEGSDVLARKTPGAIKCPKKAKLVKGKCLMQVEE